MTKFDLWYISFEDNLQFLYYKLINISKENGLFIIESENSYNDFVDMIYNESSGNIFDNIFNNQ